MSPEALTFTRIAHGSEEKRALALDNLVIAGWTGRNREAVEAHIAELARLGVAPPRRIPMFYRAAASLLTHAPAIQVAGREATGEIELVLLRFDDGLWVGVGSDHTDRKLETSGVTLSKQLCAKPLSRAVWRLDDIRDHWDELELRSNAVISGERRSYQHGTAAAMRPPEELMSLAFGQADLSPGTAMFGGTLAVDGQIAFATRFEMEVHDPVLRRSIFHAYDVHDLPIEG